MEGIGEARRILPIAKWETKLLEETDIDGNLFGVLPRKWIGGVVLLGSRLRRTVDMRNKWIRTALGMIVLLVVLFCLISQKTYAYVTPDGYNDHDYQKLVAFLELPNGAEKNGDKLSADYDPEKPITWRGVFWNKEADNKVYGISWYSIGLVGNLDVSGCTALTNLYCGRNQLIGLDVSGCTALMTLGCSSNRLTGLDMTGCTALKTLDCSNNQLTGLDVSGYTALMTLDCSYNRLAALNMSGCTALETLDCSYSLLAALDVSGCTVLETLDCSHTQLTGLDVNGCMALETLDCSFTQLTDIDVNGCSALTYLNCSSNQLTALDVSGFAALTNLDCSSNQMAALDVSGCTVLETLTCYNNQLTALDVSDCTALTNLYCWYSQLIALDVSGCTALKTLNCYNNQLTALDVSDCTALIALTCNANQLAALDVSDCTLLQNLLCQNNRLTALDVSDCIALKTLRCYSNQLAALDVSNSMLLRELNCQNNQLATLDVSGCIALTTLNCYSNELLFSSLPLFIKAQYDYSPQSRMQVSSSGKVVIGNEIDLSSEAIINGIETVYTWHKNDGSEIEPATSANGTFTFDRGFGVQTIYCQMTNATFPELTLETEMILLTGPVKPEISIQPQNITVISGTIAAFSVTATATDAGAGGVLSYQWQLSTDGGSGWSDIEDAVDNSYERGVTFIDNGNRYRCVITNTKDEITATIFSNPAILSVINLTITCQPQDTTVIEGATVTFSIAVEVADDEVGGVLSYQWQRSTDGGRNWLDIDGANANSYSITEVTFADNGRQYRCTVTNTRDGIAALIHSSPAMLSVVARPAITSQPQNRIIPEGDAAPFAVTAKAADAGIGGVLSYQWQLSIDGGSVWSDIDGANTKSYTTTATTFPNNGQQYRCTVTNNRNGVTITVISNPAILSVVANPTITSQPQNTTVPVGATATFSVSTEAPDAAEGGILSYQWQLSTDGGSVWSNISGATSYSFITPAVAFVSNGNQYRCQVFNTRNGVTATVSSNPATLSVAASPAIINQPQNITVLEGATATFGVTAEAADAGIGGILSYQWQLSTNGGSSWSNIGGATTNSHTTPAVMFANNDHQYRCQVINTREGVSATFFSNPAILSVVANPMITSQPQDTAILEGATATFSVTAEAADSGAGGVLSYQWQLSTDSGSSWSNVDGATTHSYTTALVTFANNGYQYRCKVTNTKNAVSAEAFSATATLIVKTHRISFIKPTAANDEYNPVNINSGSLVLAQIIGEMAEVAAVTIKIDEGLAKYITPSGNTIYYLLPADLSEGWHTVTIKLINKANHAIEATVTFYWDSYRRGFGFGRFDFGEAGDH
jgi:Leucine-rich repeat (LRR) protein